MNESWTPDIELLNGTLHDRILRALRQDIASGDLAPEGKLPPQRVLAHRIGVGIGTVTRAYAEAEALGIVTSTVGSGTFVATSVAVAAQNDRDDSIIDLSLNVQNLTSVTSRLSEAMTRAQGRADLTDYVTYAPHAGIEWHRRALAEWLRSSSNFDSADWRRLAITSGSQHGMSLVIDELCRPGDSILTEAATFSGFLSIANDGGMICHGVAMDRYGIIPAALEDAVRRTRARVVYLQPNLHNPTTRTMPMSRRIEIVDLARRLDLMLLEDDVYGAIAFASDRADRSLVPLAMLAPERIWYVSSVSKALAPGLRVGVVIAPDSQRFDRLLLTIRANCYAVATLPSLIVSQWINDGTARQLLHIATDEAATRLRLAQRYLGDAIEQPSVDTSLHVWLPMSELRAERLAHTALRRGVMLTPPGSMLVDGEAVSGVRLCLNTVTRPRLERALRIVRSILADDLVPARNSIV